MYIYIYINILIHKYIYIYKLNFSNVYFGRVDVVSPSLNQGGPSSPHHFDLHPLDLVVHVLLIPSILRALQANPQGIRQGCTSIPTGYGKSLYSWVFMGYNVGTLHFYHLEIKSIDIPSPIKSWEVSSWPRTKKLPPNLGVEPSTFTRM